MILTLQNKTIDTDEMSQLYPAAIIEYADGTITPISLEWFDDMANKDVKLLHYAICVHYKEEERTPTIFPYENREALEEGIAELAEQINSAGS